MDEVQIQLLEHRELADAEQTISHLQVEIEYYKKMLWSNDAAIKKEENNLKKLQAKYCEEFKDQRSNEHENH